MAGAPGGRDGAGAAGDSGEEAGVGPGEVDGRKGGANGAGVLFGEGAGGGGVFLDEGEVAVGVGENGGGERGEG